MVDAFIKPVFMRPRTTSTPVVRTKVASVLNGASDTLDIQPPEGQQWVVNYANILLNTFSANTYAFIQYVDNGTAIDVEYAVLTGAGQSISVASFGNGPIVVTQTRFLRLQITGTTGTNVAHMVVLAEEM